MRKPASPKPRPGGAKPKAGGTTRAGHRGNVATDAVRAPRAESPAAPGAREGVVLLSGGNPRIAKADGDAPVQAYIAAMPGWKREIGARLDALVARHVPRVKKAVRWNSPLYGVEGRGWFLGLHVFDRYVKVTFFRGTSLRPVPPGGAGEARWVDVHEDDLNEAAMARWVKQAAALPGWVPGGASPRSTKEGDASEVPDRPRARTRGAGAADPRGSGSGSGERRGARRPRGASVTETTARAVAEARPTPAPQEVAQVGGEQAAGGAGSRLVDRRIRALEGWRGETLARMRALILEADPEIVEDCKWVKPTNPAGVPVWSHDGIVCTGETYAKAVKLTFAHGAMLPDPARLFNASLEGNLRRAIDIHEGETVDAGAFQALVRAAVARNRSAAKKR